MALIGPHGFLLSGQLTSGAGADVMDARATRNFGYLEYASYAPSAIISLQTSHDGTGWMHAITVTATTTTGTAQVSAYYPWIRGVYVTGWSTTASANMFYAPGVMRIL